MKPFKAIVVTLLCGVCCGSCQSYYAVTDLKTRDVYYTQGSLYMMERRHGGLEFEDLVTGDEIVLESARAHEISAQQAREMLKHPSPTSKP